MKQLGLRLLKAIFHRRKPKKDELLVLPQNSEDMDEILDKAIRESFTRGDYVSDQKCFGSRSFWFYLKHELKEWWNGDRWDSEFRWLSKPVFVGSKLLMLLWLWIIFQGIGVGIFGLAFDWGAILIGGIGFLITPGIYLYGRYVKFNRWRKEFERKVRDKRIELTPSGRKEYIAQLYKGLIDNYSDMVTGQNSPIGAVLARCDRAEKESKQSFKHWTDRFREAAHTGTIAEEETYLRERIDLAKQLVRKFEGMKARLEPQRTMLQEFFEGVRRQIPIIESVASDYFENRRLQYLADEADAMEPEIDLVGLKIFHRFSKEMLFVQDISASLSGVSVEYFSVDQLESCAERIFKINESAEKRIKLLEAQVSGAAA